MACPTFAGTLVSVDDKAARALAGVIDVLRLADAVAVVGEHYWAAKKGLEALVIEWDRGVNATLSTQQLRAALCPDCRKGKQYLAQSYHCKSLIDYFQFGLQGVCGECGRW